MPDNYRYYYKLDETYHHIGHVMRHEDDGDIELGEDVYFTNVEAQIIAFALDAIAKGKRIAAVESFIGEHGLVCMYDGPTQGVAPRVTT